MVLQTLSKRNRLDPLFQSEDFPLLTQNYENEKSLIKFMKEGRVRIKIIEGKAMVRVLIMNGEGILILIKIKNETG